MPSQLSSKRCSRSHFMSMLILFLFFKLVLLRSLFRSSIPHAKTQINTWIHSQRILFLQLPTRHPTTSTSLLWPLRHHRTTCLCYIISIASKCSNRGYSPFLRTFASKTSGDFVDEISVSFYIFLFLQLHNMSCDIGVYGLSVMGQNLALNIASKGFSVAVCNRSSDRVFPAPASPTLGRRVHRACRARGGRREDVRLQGRMLFQRPLICSPRSSSANSRSPAASSCSSRPVPQWKRPSRSSTSS